MNIKDSLKYFFWSPKTAKNFFLPREEDIYRWQRDPDRPNKTIFDVILYYILEWAIILLIVIFAIIVFNVPYPQLLYFRLDDPSINLPSAKHETIPFNLIVGAFVVGIPLGLFVLFHLLFIKNIHDFHHAILGYIQSLSFTMIFLFFFWFFSPVYRPDFLDNCQPIPEKVQYYTQLRKKPYNDYVYFTAAEVCKNAASFVEASVNETPSFPSGHAANLMAIWVFFLLYFHSKIKALLTYNIEKHHLAMGFFKRGLFFIFGIYSIIFLIGIWIGMISRVTDHRHTWVQVVVGAIIGIPSGFIVYAYKYCSVFGKDSHIPLYYYWRIMPTRKAKKKRPDKIVINHHKTAASAANELNNPTVATLDSLPVASVNRGNAENSSQVEQLEEGMYNSSNHNE
ncbi:hypothetical protein ABK040_008182 [Willaertia magna]